MLRHSPKVSPRARCDANHKGVDACWSTLFFMRSTLTFLVFLSAMAIPCLSDPTPVIRADLRQFGYESFPRKMVRSVALSLSFIDERRVAIAWTAPDTTKSNRHKEPHRGDAAHVSVVVMDTSSGQKQAKKEWPAPFSYLSPDLAGRGSGKILICAGDVLRLLSVTLETVREKNLQSHSSCNPSPSGSTVLVVGFSDDARHLQVMDTESLEVLSSWTEKRNVHAGAFAVSEHRLLGYCGKPEELCIRRFDEGWHALHVPGVQTRTTEGHPISATFVNDQVLAIRDKIITLANIDGGMLFQISPTDKHLFESPVVSSLNGEHFVILEGRLRGITSGPLDMYPFYADDRATVYDIKKHHSDFSIKLQGTSPWTPWHAIHNVIALSPDGTSLALISEGVLQVFLIATHSGEQQ